MTPYDEARESRPHVTINGTPYMLGKTGYVPELRSIESPALTAAGFAVSIRRCCNGDDHKAYATLPDRYTATVEMAQTWRARIDASGYDPDEWYYPQEDAMT